MFYVISVFLLLVSFSLSFADTGIDQPQSTITLKRIVLLNSLEFLPEPQLAEISNIETVGFNSEESNDLKIILKPFYEKQTFDKEEIKKAITEHYLKNEQQVLVEISLQDSELGVLQIVIKKEHRENSDLQIQCQEPSNQLLEPNLSLITLKGIVLLNSLEFLPEPQLAKISNIETIGFNSEESNDLKIILKPFYEKQTFDKEEIKKAITEHYLKNEQQVLVEISLQDSELGALQIVIKKEHRENPDLQIECHEPYNQLLEPSPSFEDLSEKKYPLKKIQDRVKAIVLISSENQMRRSRDAKVKGVQIKLDFPGCIKPLIDALSVYLEKPLDEEIICQIEQTIFSCYYDIHYPFVIIEFPKQDVTNGVLHVVVCESTLGEICIEPNEGYAVHKIMDYMRLCPGEKINESILFNDVAWLNRNPFRQIDIVYRPGIEECTTDILLQANARRRFRLYGGVDNTGVKTIQRERFFAGFNLTDYQQMFTYQYTSSFNTTRFQAHSLQYTFPCAWRNIVNIYGGYAKVCPNLPLPIMHNKGWGMQASLRYVIPFKTYPRLTHEMSLGGDFKRTNNTVEFSDNSPRIASNVNLTQVMLEYKGAYSGSRNRVDYQLQGFCSPGRWLADQTDFLYSQLRPNAKNHWIYGRLNCTVSQKLPEDFYFSVGFSGQLSNQNLLPSEQFYIGGYDTVRGYDERELNTDTGLFIRTEIFSPTFHFIDSCCDKLELLVFFDYGYANNHTPIPPEGKNSHLMSVGPGLRYAFSNYFAARLDYGIQLYHKDFFGSSHQRVHFGVIASY